MAHIETIETYGGIGTVGIVPTVVTQWLKKMQTDGKMYGSQQSQVLREAWSNEDRLRRVHCGPGANKERYSALCTELANQYGFGNDLYPKAVNQCLTMLNRHTDAPSARQ